MNILYILLKLDNRYYWKKKIDIIIYKSKNKYKYI